MSQVALVGIAVSVALLFHSWLLLFGVHERSAAALRAWAASAALAAASFLASAIVVMVVIRDIRKDPVNHGTQLEEEIFGIYGWQFLTVLFLLEAGKGSDEGKCFRIRGVFATYLQ